MRVDRRRPPGFINFKLKQSALAAVINEVITAGDDYGKNDSGKDKHMLLEWVSANPTGDLHCGHARNAAWGDCICRLMEASGWDVLREFYVNDATTRSSSSANPSPRATLSLSARNIPCPRTATMPTI
ncbi:MAG: arginine--tRNA ligase [Oscillospiraceae bacterium]